MGIHEQLAEIKYQEGLEEGLEQGLEKGKEEFIQSLMAKTEFSPAKIAELVGVSVSFVNKVKKKALTASASSRK